MRLSKQEAEAVKVGLVNALIREEFRHPKRLPNNFGDIWINEQKKRAYLRRLAEKGLIRAAWHERGWYRWYTYALNILDGEK